MNSSTEPLDRAVRAFVYDHTFRSGVPPHSTDVASSVGASVGDVAASFRRLAEGRVLVLQSGTDEILMANPFSAVPTPFAVEVAGLSTYGNCIWDALGIAAMLDRAAQIKASCGDCGAAAEVSVGGGVVRGEGVIHFALPAREWWKDIVFT